jgi:hypothetical protein
VSVANPDDKASAPELQSNRSRSPGLDAAVILTLTAAAMYLLGWQYCSSFYGYFGIGSSFIELDTNQVVALTWPIVFIVGSVLIQVWPREDQGERANRGVILSASSILRALALAVLWVVFFTQTRRPWVAMVVLVATVAAFLLTYGTAFGRKKWLEFRVPSLFHAWFYALACLILLNLFYDTLGSTLAALAVSHPQGAPVRFHFQGVADAPQEGMLIAHMKGKYFVYGRTAADKKPRTYIIGDSIVETAVITPR